MSSVPGFVTERGMRRREARTAFVWAGSRMRAVTDQERARRSGMRRRATLPWAPRRRICGGDIV